MKNEFVPGQRWISNTESELGLGLILDAEFNRVTVLYLATGERRVYARDNAPLTRVIFAEGDLIDTADQVKMTVQSVERQDGLIRYRCLKNDGQEAVIDEMELNHHIQFNRPHERLFTGQLDPSRWFELRYQTWKRLQRLDSAESKGLQGGRISLIPHQLYIAHEAANRATPRVMLADEVGLGKTIEAGLILHHRLLNGLSRRVLIIVPDSLLHQWLVEMLRRFNLKFSIFDEARCSEYLQQNPFSTEQLVLCGQGFFSEYPGRQQQALEAGWDMVVVDEAHHLQWREDKPSAEYVFVEQLAQSVSGLILLTATPEQLGAESHFARLRLLDPDRFYDFKQFLKEQEAFEPVAAVANQLIAGKIPAADELAALQQRLNSEQVDRLCLSLNDPEQSESAAQALLNVLLDHHGAGRILFRNSRQTVKGFPERERFAYPLQGQAQAERLQDDPYVQWLVNKLGDLGKQKALLICRQAETVIQLSQYLRDRHGIASAIFHEGMTIVERDRAAAYFADEESQAQLLICSEIGSEGRNFQFVHHLILFDLPDNPDLLQQRIGRLDRIGQQEIIKLHIPYLEGSFQDVLFRWYDEALDVFRKNASGSAQVADCVADSLAQLRLQYDKTKADAFIEHSQELAVQIEEQLHNGRDQLLELNSCRMEEAQQLIAQVLESEQEGGLWPYMESIFDCYGVDVEYHSPGCHILRPSENLRIAHFPFLKDEGLTLTDRREIALAREDMLFLSDEHPMVTAAMDLVLSSETGNAAISVVKHPQLTPGRFLLEILFVAACSAPTELQIGRYLAHTPIRVLIDQETQDVTDKIDHENLVESGVKFDKHQISLFLNQQREHILGMIELAKLRAEQSMQTLVETAGQQMLDSLKSETERLQTLQKINPNIKDEEIEFLKEKAELSFQQIQATQLKMDAVRFIISS